MNIPEPQKQQLMATTLTNGQNAWDYVQSCPQESQFPAAKVRRISEITARNSQKSQ